MRWASQPHPLVGVPALEATGLTARYLRDPDFAGAFYGSHWRNDAAYGAIRAVLTDRSYPRRELAAILRRQNDAWGGSEATQRSIDAIESEAVCVFTGQQAGLFGGPLYTVHKALAAVSWADHLSQERGIPAVPVFWLAGDDHDIDEIDHAVVPGENGTLRTLRYRDDGTVAARVSRRQLGDGIAAWLDDVLPGLPEGPFADDLRADLRETYRPAATWVDSFATLITRWLGRYGIVFVNPDDADLKRLMAPVFRAEIDDPEDSRARVDARDREIRASGYHPQVGRTEDSTLLFVDGDDGARQRVDTSPGGFTWADRAEPLSRADLLGMLDASPDRFSANALLRPVSADAVFPTIMHVMGPGETAYMAQSRVVYERHGVPMPIVAPRAGFTVVELEITELLAEHAIDLVDAFAGVDAVVGNRAESAYAEHVSEHVDALRARIDEAYADAYRAIADQLPGVANAADSARIKSHGLVNKLSRKLAQELRRRESPHRDDLRRIVDAICPSGMPQERVYSALGHVARYGSGWFDALLDLLRDDRTTHRALFPAE